MHQDDEGGRKMEQRAQHHVVVVGAGLAGLTAAATAAEGGARVTLLEAREHRGGRARTLRADGFLLNQGAHALYRGGPAWAALSELGIHPHGNPPDASHAQALRADGSLARLPGNVGSLSTSPLLSARGKVQLARVLARAQHLADLAEPGTSARQWIDGRSRDATVRSLLRLLLRTATYCDELDRLDAAAALRQLAQVAAHGVIYLDGGFQQLVDALQNVADARGVLTHTTAKVHAIDELDGRFLLRTANGDFEADAVVHATGGPVDVDRVLHGASATVHDWARRERPVHAAALDLAMRALPSPESRVVFGLDEPLYFSVHTPSARLVTEGRGEVAHLLWYGDTHDDPRPHLEALLDRAQPGWRDEVVDARYGRRLVVAHGRPLPGSGFAGRPPVTVPDVPGLFVAGDWVGPEGLLTDAVMASGRAAGRAAARPSPARLRATA
jgi:phytoene dehydrogenase-like protein